MKEVDNIFCNLNQILIYLIEGNMDAANDLFNKTEPELINNMQCTEFIINFRKFIHLYHDGAIFLNAIANGNLDVSPPEDPLHQNYVITQYKQLHSNLNHLTWQAQQIAKGDLRQKVSFLGEFSIGFNKMIEALREKELMEDKIKMQYEELQKLNAEKDKFFSIIAHDLRGPFSGFLGLTQIMAEELSSLTMTEIQDLAASMKDSATNLYRLLENLLQWAKMQQGLIRFDLKEIQLHPVVDESITMVKDIAKNKGIEITSNIPDDLEVYADSNMLQTIIRNLVSNAMKFTPKGGKISVSAKATGDKGVEISVKDTGIGMTSEMVNNLFRLDVKTNREGTEGEPSSGLGLLLCKEFIEKQDGKIWVESEVGKGSTFYFSLPNML